MIVIRATYRNITRVTPIPTAFPTWDTCQAEISKKDHAKEELLQSFRARDSTRYLVALQLAKDAEVDPEDIPCIYSLHRLSDSFQVPDIDVNVLSLKAQLCFVLDYTNSMKTQVAQAKTSVTQMIEAVRSGVTSGTPGTPQIIEVFR